MPRTSDPAAVALAELRAFGLAYPGAHTKSPWPGHEDLATNGKTFAFMSSAGEPFSLTCKLPGSGTAALMLPFASPTGYGLGKSGWVTATFSKGEHPPLPVLKAWVDESYRAVAPKKLIKELDAGAQPAGERPSAKGGTRAGAASPRAGKTGERATAPAPERTKKKSGTAGRGAAAKRKSVAKTSAPKARKRR
jgi:predicted DNA-binding protein (MmcQ/YjbR family)